MAKSIARDTAPSRVATAEQLKSLRRSVIRRFRALHFLRESLHTVLICLLRDGE
jgi:hypothetical protein